METVIGCFLDETGCAPTIDAVPVVHGEWAKNKDCAGWTCSACHTVDLYAYFYDSDKEIEGLQDNYCPNCGADMRGDV